MFTLRLIKLLEKHYIFGNRQPKKMINLLIIIITIILIMVKYDRDNGDNDVDIFPGL